MGVSMINIMKSNISLYLFLALSILTGWYYNRVGKQFAKKYEIAVVLLVETIVVLMCVLTALIYNHRDMPGIVLQHLQGITVNDYIIFILFAAYVALVSFFGLEFLKYHDVAKIRVSEFIISVPISAIGLYYFSEDKITTEKFIGLIMVAVGGYFFMK